MLKLSCETKRWLKTFPVNESVLQSPIAGPTVAGAVALVVVSGPAMEKD